MAIAYASSTLQAVASAAATVSVAQPAGVAAGDLLVAFCWANNTSSTWTASGFTQLSPASSDGCAVLTKVATGSESWPLTFTRATSTAAAAGVIMMRITNAGAAQAAVTTSGTGPTTLASVTATTAGTYLLEVLTRALAGTDTWTPPASAVKRFDATSTGTGCGGAAGDEIVASGATGTRAWTHTGTGATRGAMIAITAGTGGAPGTNRKVRVAGATRAATTYVRRAGSASAAVNKVRRGGAAW